MPTSTKPKSTIQIPNEAYTEAAPAWSQCRDVFDGARKVKAKGETYLPKPPAMKTDKYNAYKMRAEFFNGFARTVKGLLGSVMRKEPAVQLPEALRPGLVDVTKTGVPFDGFAQQTLEEVLKIGRFGVLLDLPEQAAANVAPNWVPYLGEQIINGRIELVKGDPTLTMLILKERVEQDGGDPYHPDCVDQIRELRIVKGQYVIQLWREVKSEDGKESEFVRFGDPLFPMRRGVALEEIPFVCFGPESLDFDIQKPPLEDLSELNLTHYRLSADQHNGLHYIGIPQPWVSGMKAGGDSKLQIGGGTAWKLPDPASRAGFLEFSGQGLKPMKDAIDDVERRMAILGAKMLEGQKPGVEAADTVRMRHAGDSATLKSITAIVSLGLSECLRWHVWWAGQDVQDNQVSVTLNTDFFGVVLSADEVKTMILQLQAGTISYETFYWKLSTGGWARPGVTAEQEIEEINSGRNKLEIGSPYDKGEDNEEEDEDAA